MAGHSQFKNIMHRKGAQDAKRSKLFTRLIREITIAAREGGTDAESNSRLRSALESARTANMPRDNIERALHKGEGNGQAYEILRYEGFGPGGVAIIVEASTDNRNRTNAQIRTIFGKNGGNLAEPNAVIFLFDRLGRIEYPPSIGSPETLFEAALEAGASDVVSSSLLHEIFCSALQFGEVREQLRERLGPPDLAELIWRPHEPVTLGEDAVRVLRRLVVALDACDDVHAIDTNLDASEDVLEGLAS